jgi:transposase-like protein
LFAWGVGLSLHSYWFIGVAPAWRRNWARVIPFFDYPPEIRKVIYAPKQVPLGDTTNAIESINTSLRKVTKTRSSFPTDDAVTRLCYLAPDNISKKWSMPIRDWKAALNRFTIQFEDRLLPG